MKLTAHIKRLAIIACSGALFLPLPALAETDALIEGAKLCTRHLSHYEREYGIPTHLLSAIASTESGRYHDGLKIKVPWPWTINAEGKGYIFASKEEAIAAVRQLHAQGIQSIDVGCMQVNLYHHPQAFASLDQAFEPESNIAYAASFLRSLYQDGGSWKKAAGDYHSKTPSLGNEYVGLVYNSWYQIIDKLRAARLQVPSEAVTAMNDMKADGFATPGAVPAAASGVKIVRETEKSGGKSSAYHAPRMNSIQVSHHQNSRENGIIIVRPQVHMVDNDSIRSIPVSTAASTTPITMAQTKPDLLEPVAPAPDAKIIHVNAQTSGKRAEPNFIFND